MKVKQVSAGVVEFSFPFLVAVDLDDIIDGETTVSAIVTEAIKINKAELTKTIETLAQERADAINATR